MSVPGKNRHGTVADSSETVKYHEYLKLLKSHCVHVALLQFTLVVWESGYRQWRIFYM